MSQGVVDWSMVVGLLRQPADWSWELQIFEWWVFRRQHPKLDPSIGSRIGATKVQHLVSYHAIIFISTTHDCYDRSSSPIHPRERHWFTKYRIMGLGHEVLAGDAVLTSGLDGESSVVGEPIWRSLDAHELQKKRSGSYVEAYRRGLRDKSVRVHFQDPHNYHVLWNRGLEKWYILSIMFGQWALIDWASNRLGGEMNHSVGIAVVAVSLPVGPTWGVVRLRSEWALIVETLQVTCES